MSSALIVFAKRPEAGAVKTRLVPPLSAEDAVRLYSAFVEDLLHKLRDPGFDVRLYLTGGGPDAFKVPDGVTVLEQVGIGLGDRMLHAFEETFAAGYTNAVIVGTDHPNLPLAIVAKAFDTLQVPGSVVIGPAEDGGYYLLGMNALRPELFGGMEYGNAKVFSETLTRIRATDATLSVGPHWYDVDEKEDLVRLAHDLQDDGGAAPRTQTVIQDLSLSYPWLHGDGLRRKR